MVILSVTPKIFLTNFKDFFVNVGPKLMSDIQNTRKKFFNHNMRVTNSVLTKVLVMAILKFHH